MTPYNYEKVKIANELYPRLLKCEGNVMKNSLRFEREAN